MWSLMPHCLPFVISPLQVVTRSSSFLSAMARSKQPPRRVIEKRRRNGMIQVASTHVATLEHPPVVIFSSSSGVRGEILRLESAPDARTHVIVLPGNPGVIEFYRPLLRMLHARLPHDVQKEVQIHGVGLPGHDLRELNGLQTFNIAAHVDYVSEYITSLGDGKILLVGHSYGSFLGVKVAQRVGVERCSLAMLMPALWHMGYCAGAWRRAVLRSSIIAEWLMWGVTAAAPPVLKEMIFGGLGWWEGIGEVSRRFVDGRRRGLYKNICALGRDEMDKILEVKDCGMGRRCLLIWCEDDDWCPRGAQEEIVKVFGCRTEEAVGCSHALVLQEEQTAVISRLVAAWVCERVR